jgi:hypothetical protein
MIARWFFAACHVLCVKRQGNSSFGTICQVSIFFVYENCSNVIHDFPHTLNCVSFVTKNAEPWSFSLLSGARQGFPAIVQPINNVIYVQPVVSTEPISFIQPQRQWKLTSKRLSEKKIFLLYKNDLDSEWNKSRLNFDVSIR